MLIALTRAVSPTITECALSFQQRQPIDFPVAQAQHQAYEALLRRLGVSVHSLPPEPQLPDAVFVEDTAIVLDEVAVLTAPALASRMPEVASVARVLATHRPVERISAGARIEGGDVLRVGSTLFVGLSCRTDAAGAAQLEAIVRPHGYTVTTLPVRNCLHLKTACTFIGRNTILANPTFVDTAAFAEWEVIEVHEEEGEAANALVIGDTVILPEGFPRTCQRLREHGFTVEAVEIGELRKAEAGVTCCSILFTT